MIGALMLLTGLGALGGVVEGRGASRTRVRMTALYVRPDLAEPTALPLWVQQAVDAADLTARQVRSGRVAMKIGVAMSLGCGFTYSSRGGLVFLLAVCGLPVAFVLANQHRRDRRLLAALPDALELIARSLRSGASIVQALADASLGVAGPLRVALGRVVDDTNRGDSLGRALGRFAERSSLGEVRVAVAALTLATESGASPARALDGVSASLRDGQRLQSELAALTSQARASAVVLIALPIVFVGVNAAIDPSALAFLFHDRFGRLCLGLGLVLDAIGWIWMRALVGQVRA